MRHLILLAALLLACAAPAFAQGFIAEAEQRRAILRDLLDTCAKCRAASNENIEAEPGSERQKSAQGRFERCIEFLDEKLTRTPIHRLAPGMSPPPKADVPMVKRMLVWHIYDAYEYGLELAKK